MWLWLTLNYKTKCNINATYFVGPHNCLVSFSIEIDERLYFSSYEAAENKYQRYIKAVLINLLHSNKSKPQKVDSTAFISGNIKEVFSI